MRVDADLFYLALAGGLVKTLFEVVLVEVLNAALIVLRHVLDGKYDLPSVDVERYMVYYFIYDLFGLALFIILGLELELLDDVDDRFLFVLLLGY